MKMRPKRLKRMQRQQPHPWKLILRIWMWWASLTSWILAMGCRSSTSSSMKTGLCCPHVTSFICLFIPSRRIWMTQTGPVLESPGGTIDEKQCLRFNCVSLGVLSLVCLRLLYISFVCVMCHFYLNSSNFNPLRRSTWLTTTPSTSRRPVVCSTPMKVQVFKFPPFFCPLIAYVKHTNTCGFRKFSSTKLEEFPPHFTLRGMELSTVRPWEVRRFIGCDPRHREHGPRIFKGRKFVDFHLLTLDEFLLLGTDLLELNRFFVRRKSLRIRHWKILSRWPRSCFLWFWWHNGLDTIVNRMCWKFQVELGSKEHRRERERRVDAGDETAKLKFTRLSYLIGCRKCKSSGNFQVSNSFATVTSILIFWFF